MKTSDKSVIVSLLAAVVALLAFAASAEAASQKRNIEGVLRNDKNVPVAGTLKVTFRSGTPTQNFRPSPRKKSFKL